MTKLFNKNIVKKKRKELRNNMTRAEIYLWMELKSKKLLGFKFRRQYSIGPFIVDFYCIELKFAIEVDGASH